jgi:hypothetical protein
MLEVAEYSCSGGINGARMNMEEHEAF